MRSVDGKRVLITGAAQGMGKTIAEYLAEEGAELILTDLDSETLEETRAEFESSDLQCSAYPLDVTDVDAVRALRNSIHDDLGPIDILVNNAGVVFGGAFLDLPLEQHLLTHRVNVSGVMALTHTFLPDLIEAEEAHLVNMASASGFVGLPWGSSYASSKWAVIGFSESIRLELKRQHHRHVGVTTVCPSYVSTGMFKGVRPPLLTSFLTPEEIAEKIHTAIVKDQIFVLEPWLVKITPFLKGVLPTFMSDMLADAFGASSSMRSWRGREPD